LITVYGPNSDTPDFYDIKETTNTFSNEFSIVCGNFNLVLNPKIDYNKNYKHVNNPKAGEKLIELIEELGMIDIYREQHPELQRYTWRSSNPIKQARLDFFLITENLLQCVNNSCIEPGYRSDHSMPIISLKKIEFKKGKELWKFNSSLLHDLNYFENINKLILEVKTQYALPVYHSNNIDNIPDSEIQFQINDQLFLETLLIEIRGKTISYSSYQKISRL